MDLHGLGGPFDHDKKMPYEALRIFRPARLSCSPDFPLRRGLVMSGAIIMKFGGTSVADARCIADSAALIRAAHSQSPSRGILVVLSACAKATDSLFECARLAVTGHEDDSISELERLLERHRAIAGKLFGAAIPVAVSGTIDAARMEIGTVLRGIAMLGEVPAKSLDLVTGRGELLSSRILASFLGSEWLDAREVMRTDSGHGAAKPVAAETRKLCSDNLLSLLDAGRIVVTQGYIGSDAAGTPTTLGRGGSDYSASLFGAAVDASEIQIWTDVEGVLTCDPRVVPDATPVERLGYEEAAELAAFGAKVLHPATILPAISQGIPVTVRNSRLPRGRFTTISAHASSGMSVTALASRGPVTVITVRSPGLLGGVGFLSRIVEAFARRGVGIDIVSTSEVAVSMTVEANADLGPLTQELSSFAEVSVARDRAIIAIVGECLRRTPGVPGIALQSLSKLPVEMISLSANEINLSLVIERRLVDEALRLLHSAFFGSALRIAS